ncbi:MAG: hypothetical protein IKL65_00170 [Bacilli bacterium]|nr:hypothetical protein [Bacilli bacterium]
MKLEVGMYVRTKNGITQVWKAYEPFFLDTEYKQIYNEEIVKASHNIIDLIEVGDYVNGYYVSKIWKENEITHYVDETPIKRKERQITIQAPSYGGIIHLKNEDIESIVTKEQFLQMEYKVGE